jgi:hypothetical protein
MMKMEIDIPDEKIKDLAQDIMENYPEYSSPSLQCISWKYKDGIYKFIDEETEKTYTVTIGQIEKTLPKFIQGVMEGRWKFYGLNADNILEFDAGSWDADIVDGVVQLAIFGDIIYG